MSVPVAADPESDAIGRRFVSHPNVLDTSGQIVLTLEHL